MKTYTYDQCPVPIKRSVMDSGLEVITVDNGADLTHVGIALRAGGLYDTIPGTAHFLEHLMLEGPARGGFHPVLEPLCFKGARAGAHTTMASVVYWALIERANITSAINALSKLVFNPSFTEDMVQKERGVILAENRQNTSRAHSFSLWCKNILYPDVPRLSIPLDGNREDIQSIDKDVLQRFHEANYHTGNAAVIVIGGVEHDAVVDQVRSVIPENKSLAQNELSGYLPGCGGDSLFESADTQSFVDIVFPLVNNGNMECSAIEQAFDLLTIPRHGSLFTKLRTEDSLVYALDYDVRNGIGNLAKLTIYADHSDFDYVTEVAVRKLEEIASGNIPETAWSLIQSRNRLRSLEAREAWFTGTGFYLDLIFDSVEERWLWNEFEEPYMYEALENMTVSSIVQAVNRLLEYEPSIIGLRNPA